MTTDGWPAASVIEFVPCEPECTTPRTRGSTCASGAKRQTPCCDQSNRRLSSSTVLLREQRDTVRRPGASAARTAASNRSGWLDAANVPNVISSGGSSAAKNSSSRSGNPAWSLSQWVNPVSE